MPKKFIKPIIVLSALFLLGSVIVFYPTNQKLSDFCSLDMNLVTELNYEVMVGSPLYFYGSKVSIQNGGEGNRTASVTDKTENKLF